MNTIDSIDKFLDHHEIINDIELIIKDCFDNKIVLPKELCDNKLYAQFIFLINDILKDIHNNKNYDKFNIINYINDKLYTLNIIVKPPEYTESQLEYIKNKIEYLEKIPQPEQRTEKWHIFRNNRLTASDLGHILDTKKNNIKNSKYCELIKKKCGVEMPFISGAAIRHGIKFEQVATSIYEKINNLNILEFGCIPHLHINYFGASPDGIVSYNSNNKNYIGRMLEIKCPKSRIINGEIPPGYFAQIQGQLEVCDLEYCDYLECDFQFYNSKEDFFKNHDNKEISVKTDKEKGVIIELFDNKTKKYIYHYGLDEQIKDEVTFTKWEKSLINSVFEQTNLEYIKTNYWYLNKINIILVKRDRLWFNNNFIKIKKFWDDVLYYRNNDISILTKSKKKYEYKEVELDFID